VFAAVLFGIKLIYVLCTALVLGSTRGALYVSTTHKRIVACLDAVHIQKGDIWIDLGCGDGRVLRHAFQRYQVKAIGYELNMMAYIRAKIMSLGMNGIQIRLRNFFKADLSNADIISCYLFPDVLPDLVHKLKSELQPGTIVVSFNFPLPSFNPKQILRPHGSLHSDPIFIYHI
jgi:trans-aconitate methyltransferase